MKRMPRLMTKNAPVVAQGHVAFNPLKTSVHDQSVDRVLKEQVVKPSPSIYQPIIKTSTPHL